MDHLDLIIGYGEKVALVGTSGSGKSTIADLICGFYQPGSGQISIDGQNLNELDQNLWRSHIALVSQDPVLFDDTIRENILFGLQGVSDEQLDNVVRQSHLAEFMNQLPEGLESRVGPNGSRLSGGQKQRVAIARAMLRNPELLILDEATSALDAQSEQMVQQALEQLMEGRTTVIIAHSYRTIQHADRILVIDKGKVKQSGSHEELIQLDGLYGQLTRLQSF